MAYGLQTYPDTVSKDDLDDLVKDYVSEDYDEKAFTPLEKAEMWVREASLEADAKLTRKKKNSNIPDLPDEFLKSFKVS